MVEESELDTLEFVGPFDYSRTPEEVYWGRPEDKIPEEIAVARKAFVVLIMQERMS